MEETWGDDQAEGGMGRSDAYLAINKLSCKIGKGLRKPAVQPKPIPPKIYNTDPTSFRNLVQKLTGTATSAVVASPMSRPANPRLQKIAPPPLKTFSFSGMPQQSSPKPDPGVSSFPKILSPIPILSPHTFSPLPGMASLERMWPNPIDSPDTVALRRLAEKMVQNENANPSVLTYPGYFPWSPAKQSCHGLASPGTNPMTVFGNVCAGVSDSPSMLFVADFSFPEPDYLSGLT